jgi:hypothetical protein
MATFGVFIWKACDSEQAEVYDSVEAEDQRGAALAVMRQYELSFASRVLVAPGTWEDAQNYDSQEFARLECPFPSRQRYSSWHRPFRLQLSAYAAADFAAPASCGACQYPDCDRFEWSARRSYCRDHWLLMHGQDRLPDRGE